MNISGIDSSLSAIRAYADNAGVRAGNIANVSTDGYRPREGRTVEQAQGGVRLDVRQSAEAPPAYTEPDTGFIREGSATDLVEDIAGGVSDGAAFTANVKVANAQNEMIGTILDLIG